MIFWIAEDAEDKLSLPHKIFILLYWLLWLIRWVICMNNFFRKYSYYLQNNNILTHFFSKKICSVTSKNLINQLYNLKLTLFQRFGFFQVFGTSAPPSVYRNSGKPIEPSANQNRKPLLSKKLWRRDIWSMEHGDLKNRRDTPITISV